MSKDIVAHHEVRFSPFRDQLLCGIRRKEFDPRVDALGLCRAGDVAGRLNAENRNALFYKILQKIAIITCNLDDETIRVQTKPSSRSARYIAVRDRASCQNRMRNKRNGR